MAFGYNDRMRIASLLASGTELVCALGQGASLIARSHECDNPAWVTSLPALSRAAFDVSGASHEIDRLVNEKLRAGQPLFEIDEELLADLAPDVILAQVHCNVCAVNPTQLDPARGWPTLRGFKTLFMRGGSLEEILDDLTKVATEIGCSSAGERLTIELRSKIARWRDSLGSVKRPKVVCLEWTDPIFPMGNWGPELVELAGGQSLLGNANAHSAPISWQAVIDADPEVLVIAPCGFNLQRAIGVMPDLGALPGWNALLAVRSNQVYVADGNRYFNRSGPAVFDTIRLLAEILHPDIVPRASEGQTYRRWEDLP